jgi:hypothetical protein
MNKITLFLLLSVNLISAAAQLECRSTAETGDPFLLLLRSQEQLADLKVNLLSLDGHPVARSRAFAVESDDTLYVFLLGLSTTLDGGSYRLVAEGLDEYLHLHRFTRRLHIAAKDFTLQQIPLNREMTALMTETDPKKVQEARNLAALLDRFDPDALYHGGAFVLPVKKDQRSSGFGDRRRYNYVGGDSQSSIHRGIDFNLSAGTTVLAPGAGNVVFAGSRIMTGLTIVIEHLPGLYSLYYHLSEMGAEEGEMVSAGQQIGMIGSTGLSTGPHLHWEVRVAGVAVDPEAFVRGEVIDVGLLEDILLEERDHTVEGR